MHYRRNGEGCSGSCCSSTGSGSNARPGCTIVDSRSSGMSPGGMLGGGPRGSRDDESPRTTPRYLVTAGDENSMVDDLPMVSPPVLGADDPDQYLFRDL